MKNTMIIIWVSGVLLAGGAAEAKTRVVATISSFGAIASEIGGDRVEVENLVKPTQDPHFVDPKPSHVLALNRADVLLLAGMELEGGWLPPLLQGARNRKIQNGQSGYLDCSTLIRPLEVQAPDRSGGDIHPGGNPHYWFDPRNGLLIARGIAGALSVASPSDTAYFNERLKGFLKTLNARIVEWDKRLQKVHGTRVVVYHESWVYLLNWAKLKQAGAIEPLPGIPPKPSHIATLLGQVKEQHVKFVLQESFYPSNMSRMFAEKSGATLLILPTMVGAEGTKTYADVVEKIVSALTR